MLCHVECLPDGYDGHRCLSVSLESTPPQFVPAAEDQLRKNPGLADSTAFVRHAPLLGRWRPYGRNGLVWAERSGSWLAAPWRRGTESSSIDRAPQGARQRRRRCTPLLGPAVGARQPDDVVDAGDRRHWAPLAGRGLAARRSAAPNPSPAARLRRSGPRRTQAFAAWLGVVVVPHRLAQLSPCSCPCCVHSPPRRQARRSATELVLASRRGWRPAATSLTMGRAAGHGVHRRLACLRASTVHRGSCGDELDVGGRPPRERYRSRARAKPRSTSFDQVPRRAEIRGGVYARNE